MRKQKPVFATTMRLILALMLGIAWIGSPTATAGAMNASAPVTGTITLWHSYESGSQEEAALNQVIQNAQTDNPGLSVVTEFHTFENIQADYQAAVQAGGGPDLLDGSTDWIGDLARSGEILNIDSYLVGNLTNVVQPAVDGMKVDGQMYGVPKNAFVVALYYNKSNLPTPPTTTAELLDMLQNDGKSIAGPGNSASYFYYAFWSAFGGQLLDGTGRCIADQGGFEPAMQYLLDLQTAGAVLDVDYANAESQFLNGDVNMLINGNWALEGYEAALGSDLGVAALPAGPSDAAHPMTDPNGYFVNPNTADPANVVNLALYMTSQASSQIFTNMAGDIPVRTDVSSADPLVNTFAQIFAQGDPRPKVPQLLNYWEPFTKEINRVLTGFETPAVGVQRACNTMNALNGFTPSTNTVTLWYPYSTGSGEETAFLQVVDSALAADPTLTIVLTQVPFENIYDDYEAAVLAGGGPDMYLAPNDRLESEANNGTILNIHTYLQGNLTNVYQSAIDGMTVNGQMYGVPESAKAVALYYNKSMIATPPSTTAELLSLLQSGETLAVPFSGTYFLYGFWSGFGGELMDNSGRCIADQGGFAPAMQYMKDLQTAGASLQTDYATAQTMFLDGDVGMLVNGPWALADYEAALGPDLGVVVLPNGPSGLSQPMNGTDGYYINPNTNNLNSAIDLALFMTNQASSQIMTDVGGHIPVRSDVTSANPLINTFAQASVQGETRPQVWQFNNYWDPFNIMITNVLAGAATPTAGVQQACFQMNELNGYTVTRNYKSTSTQDGWILESGELTNKGGTLNTSATTISLGDNAQKKQYRSILSFNTSSLPDNAVITKITLKVKKQAILGGGNPVLAFQGFMLDVRKGFFGTTAGMVVSDFQATSVFGYKTYGPFKPGLVNGWYSFNLTSAKTYINKLASNGGLTQFRLRFKLDDNNNAIANMLNLYSGNAPLASKPQLSIEYHLP